MSLYYYVRTKADLVALMQDTILADLLIPDDELPPDWREAVTVIARRTRDVLLAQQSLAALDGLDLDPAAKLSLWGIVDDYVFGSALHAIETRTRAAQAERNPQLLADALTYGQQLATGRFPRLAALYQQQAAGEQNSEVTAADPLTVQFEHGLVALLDGLTRAGTPNDATPGQPSPSGPA